MELQHEAESYCCFINNCDYQSISRERLHLYEQINGELFYPMKTWPNWIKRIFWKKPLSDKQTFMLVLFLHGNGCLPTILLAWILSSQFWAAEKWKTLKKRSFQIHWILRNIPFKLPHWYYFDMHHRRILYLNGSIKLSKGQNK